MVTRFGHRAKAAVLMKSLRVPLQSNFFPKSNRAEQTEPNANGKAASSYLTAMEQLSFSLTTPITIARE
jgi:hypothetical protein